MRVEAKIGIFLFLPLFARLHPVCGGSTETDEVGGLDPRYIQGLSGLLFCRIK